MRRRSYAGMPLPSRPWIAVARRGCPPNFRRSDRPAQDFRGRPGAGGAGPARERARALAAIAARDRSTMFVRAGAPRESGTSSSRRAAMRGSLRTITVSTCGALVTPRRVTAIDSRVVDGQLPDQPFEAGLVQVEDVARAEATASSRRATAASSASRAAQAKATDSSSFAAGTLGRYPDLVITPRFRAAPTRGRRCRGRGRWLPRVTEHRSVKSRRAGSLSSHADAPRRLL